MLGTRLWVQSNNILYTLKTGRARPRQSRAGAPNPLVNHYRCKDDKWVLLAHFQSDRYWPALCKAIGSPELEEDARFSDIAQRRQNAGELVAILDDLFATKTRDEWMPILESADLVVSPILDYQEVVNDPQVMENDFLPEFDHPALGKIRETGIPIEFSETPGAIREPAPQLGQHTEEVLVDLLGYSWADVGRLQDSGTI
jgi:crotonobetainyl-CoA:carnitine CoA-transferase CaiB-like acyl-CoA transferase